MTDAAAAPPVPPADDKDWTWVLERPCPECGYDGSGLERSEFGPRTRAAMAAFATALDRPDATERRVEDVWSALEYACHVRDVCRIFDERVRRMQDEDDPLFPDWNQNETARELQYWAQDPATVADECRGAGEAIATRWDTIGADEWDRPGRRSNGSVFTIDSIARYFLHDLTHHLHDIEA